MRASELRDVIYNPIWTSKVLHYFLSGTTISGPPKIKTEMLCLFPLIFNDSMMQLLSRANSASSFYSLFETKRNIDSKLLFIDINREIVAFREIACEALIYLANQINLRCKLVSLPLVSVHGFIVRNLQSKRRTHRSSSSNRPT